MAKEESYGIAFPERAAASERILRREELVSRVVAYAIDLAATNGFDESDAKYILEQAARDSL